MSNMIFHFIETCMQAIFFFFHIPKPNIIFIGLVHSFSVVVVSPIQNIKKRKFIWQRAVSPFPVLSVAKSSFFFFFLLFYVFMFLTRKFAIWMDRFSPIPIVHVLSFVFSTKMWQLFHWWSLSSDILATIIPSSFFLIHTLHTSHHYLLSVQKLEQPVSLHIFFIVVRHFYIEFVIETCTSLYKLTFCFVKRSI